MNRNKIVMITSCKGGVGKSTVCANLGLALARQGKRVLLVDCDFGMKCLDLILGQENSSILNLYDGVCGASIDRVIRPDSRAAAFYLCPAPDGDEGDRITEEGFLSFLSRAQDELNPDFILLDTPGDLSTPFRFARSAAGRAIIVTTHQPTAMRAAEKTAAALLGSGVRSSLVVNFFDTENLRRIRKGERSGIMEMIDRTCVGLLGIVPYSAQLADAQEKGILADQAGKHALQPFQNIAARMCGDAVPLFTGFKHRSKLKNAAL